MDSPREKISSDIEWGSGNQDDRPDLQLRTNASPSRSRITSQGLKVESIKSLRSVHDEIFFFSLTWRWYIYGFRSLQFTRHTRVAPRINTMSGFNQPALASPSGEVPDFAHPRDALKTVLLVTQCLCIPICSVLIVLRLHVRLRFGQHLGLDECGLFLVDWFFKCLWLTW